MNSLGLCLHLSPSISSYFLFSLPLLSPLSKPLPASWLFSQAGCESHFFHNYATIRDLAFIIWELIFLISDGYKMTTR